MGERVSEEFERANRRRDRKLRRRLLQVLKLAQLHAPTTELDGRLLVEEANDNVSPRIRFADDEHALTLIRELVMKDYAKERDARTHPRRQRLTLEWLRYRLTEKGQALLLEEIGPDLLVDDDRLPEGA